MNVAIWGSGYYGTKLRMILEHCDPNGKSFRAMYFVDNDEKKWGEVYLGLKILSPDTLKRSNESIDGIVIAVSNEKINDIVNQAKKIGIKRILLLPTWQYKKTDVDLNEIMEIEYEKPRLNYLEFHASEHCNLNCKGCASFCGLITEPRFIDERVLFDDLKRLKELVWGIGIIRILGGEPLLNPSLHRIVSFTRRVFPDSDLRVVTNGLLLPSLSRELINAMRCSGAVFDVSVYPPTQKRINEIKCICELNEIEYALNRIEEFYKVLDPSGKNDPHISLLNCIAPGCTLLKNGELTKCVFLQYVDLLNASFNMNFRVDNDDRINIYSDGLDGNKLVEMLNRPSGFCKYCTQNPIPYKWEAVGYKVAKEDWVIG